MLESYRRPLQLGMLLNMLILLLEAFPMSANASDSQFKSEGEFAFGVSAFCNAQKNFVLGGRLSAEKFIDADHNQRGFLDFSLGLANDNYRYSGKVGFTSQRYDVGIRQLFFEKRFLIGIGMSTRERVFRQSTYSSQKENGLPPENSPVIVFKDNSLGLLIDLAYESASDLAFKSDGGYFVNYGISYVHYLWTDKSIEGSEDFARLGSESHIRNMRSMIKTSNIDLSLYFKIAVFLL